MFFRRHKSVSKHPSADFWLPCGQGHQLAPGDLHLVGLHFNLEKVLYLATMVCIWPECVPQGSMCQQLGPSVVLMRAGRTFSARSQD
jgi:hypothetical protein